MCSTGTRCPSSWPRSRERATASRRSSSTWWRSPGPWAGPPLTAPSTLDASSGPRPSSTSRTSGTSWTAATRRANFRTFWTASSRSKFVYYGLKTFLLLERPLSSLWSQVRAPGFKFVTLGIGTLKKPSAMHHPLIVLSQFRFVLCENCDNPETVIKVQAKKGILTASCKACGHSFMLDMRHKLTTFILKVIIQFFKSVLLNMIKLTQIL